MISEEILGKRILAIDYGLKRIGFAYTDELHISNNTLPFLVNDDKKFTKIIEIIQKERIQSIVVGMPDFHIDDKSEFRTELNQFIINLKEKCRLNVNEFDESYSTEDAYKIISATKVRKNKRKESKDSISASIILKNFLEANK